MRTSGLLFYRSPGRTRLRKAGNRVRTGGRRHSPKGGAGPAMGHREEQTQAG